MKISERVLIKTSEFEGMATILHIVKNEYFYPVQVELDKPDSDGHKIIRVAFHEVIKETTQYKPTQSTPIKESSSRDAQRQMSFLDML